MKLKLLEREVFIKAPWGNIAAITWGDPSNKPVLLCHGKQDVSTGFRPLVNLLPTCFYYVSVDFPGNGKSDRFPSHSRFTVVDYVPTVSKVKEHFKWNRFAFIGHSLGAVIGKYYNIAYPDNISRMVELDPVPAHETWSPDSFAHWYHIFYGQFYSEERYQKNTAGLDTAPKYSYQKALDLMMNTRGLTPEASKHVLERSLEPAGDGLYRFNYDQRQKDIPRLPIPPEYMKELYTSTATPTLAILSSLIMELGFYETVPFVKDEAAWPHRNYNVKIVEGGHDVHINNPELISDYISKFLMEDLKAKL